MISSPYEGPLFILGAARSGTTYLLNLVNSIPEVRLVFESDIIGEAHRIFQQQNILQSREAFQSFLDHLRRVDLGSSPRPGTPLFTQPAEFYDRLYERFLEHHSLREFLQELYSAGAPGCKVWGDKTADFRQLPTILELFPSAKILVIVRDVRAVVASLLQHSGVNYYTATFLWVKLARLARSLQRELGPQQVLVVRYKDLVSQTDSVFGDVLAFLGRSSEDRSVVEQAYTTSLEKWRHQLRPEEAKRVEEIAFREMLSFGYQPEFAVRAKRLSPVSYGILLGQHALALLRNRRSTLRRLLNPAAVGKYLRLYREW